VTAGLDDEIEAWTAAVGDSRRAFPDRYFFTATAVNVFAMVVNPGFRVTSG
jgi:hypothetical protein